MDMKHWLKNIERGKAYYSYKRAQKLLSPPQIPQARPGMEFRPPLANKRLSHGTRNYSVGFVVNGIKSYEISSKLSTISGLESGK